MDDLSAGHGRWGRRDQLVDLSGQIRPCVLLQEMPGMWRAVRLSGRAWNVALERSIAASHDRVSVAEDGEERLLPSA
jgi:hypothetical protein